MKEAGTPALAAPIRCQGMNGRMKTLRKQKENMKSLKMPPRPARRRIGLLCPALCCLFFFSCGGCAAAESAAPSDGLPRPAGRTMKILVSAGPRARTATLAENASAAAFRDLLAKGPLTIAMHDYGGFEKVGPLGTGIVRSDEDITTAPGDIILYQGDQVTIYYDVNRWRLTLLGHIDGATGADIREFLGKADPKVTFSLAE